MRYKMSLVFATGVGFGFFFSLSGCVRDKDYEYAKIYNDVLSSVRFIYSKDSLLADGSSKNIIDITVFPNQLKDSINVSKAAVTVTTSNGIFVESNNSSISVTPTYKLDAQTNEKVLTAKITLQSSTKVDTAKLSIKYSGVEQSKNIVFYRSYPNKIELTPSTLQVSPNYTLKDTITAQLSSITGLPSQGSPVSLDVYDSVYARKLGILIVNPKQTNALGAATYVFVLGDSVTNLVNYLGTLHAVGWSHTGTMPISDTITIFSRR